MGEKGNQRWEEIREMGKKKFVWTHGVLRWGVLVAVAWSIINQGLRDGLDLMGFLSLDFLVRLGISLVIFGVAGYFWGRMLWKKMEEES
ncbi:hypothetical protein [Fuchsiella alkaliacetigena]|uniref:hypothetical protein n=1 Tax=Fuchsiella alkaliacetigena TaxID=957042 RepID=UPI002009F7DE|nr:hypothetical protein [Fuchsiella alkaliacetigena]MCK8824934.1 hypothetical protein [Fuchsiella alkaliacetigena]